jgi:hypothetical protein
MSKHIWMGVGLRVVVLGSALAMRIVRFRDKLSRKK